MNTKPGIGRPWLALPSGNWGLCLTSFSMGHPVLGTGTKTKIAPLSPQAVALGIRHPTSLWLRSNPQTVKT
jgi:hypothetical protein